MTDRIPEFDLTGKTAVVTGGGRGLGRAAAIALGQAGASVVVSGRTRSDLDAVRADVQAQGAEAAAVECDVRDEDAVERLVSETVSAFGSLDVMVANAGIFQRWDTSENMTPAEWDGVYETNLRGAMLTCLAAGRQMIAQSRGGSIVTISSIQGLVSVAGTAAYVAAKHGLIGLTKTLAVDWAKHDVRVNAIAPAFIARDVEPVKRDPRTTDLVASRTPMQRRGTARDVGLAVLYLASPASSYVTGTTLAVDGGWLAH